jgi:hypothetical protein
MNTQHYERFLDKFMTTSKWKKVHKLVWDDTQAYGSDLDDKTKLWIGKGNMLKQHWNFEPIGDDFTIYAVFAEAHKSCVISLELEAAE